MLHNIIKPQKIGKHINESSSLNVDAKFKKLFDAVEKILSKVIRFLLDLSLLYYWYYKR